MEVITHEVCDLHWNFTQPSASWNLNANNALWDITCSSYSHGFFSFVHCRWYSTLTLFLWNDLQPYTRMPHHYIPPKEKHLWYSTECAQFDSDKGADFNKRHGVGCFDERWWHQGRKQMYVAAAARIMVYSQTCSSSNFYTHRATTVTNSHISLTEHLGSEFNSIQFKCNSIQFKCVYLF